MKRSSRRVAFAAVLLCLGAGAVAAVMLWPREATEPTPPPAPLANNAPAAPIAESAAIAESHGLVTRSGVALDLRMKSGEVVTLTDRAKCGELPCPAGLATSYRYLGWDEKVGGYRLSVAVNAAQPMVLTYGDDDPTMLDSRHEAENLEPTPLPAKAPAAVATDESLSGWLKDLTEERDETEKPAIAAHAQRIQRDGGKLTVILDDKRRLTFEDDLVCGQLACPPQVSRSFDYVGDSPDGHFHLVRQQWNESESAMLIDGTGTILTLPSVPSFSPDGKFIVSVVSDLEEAQPQRVQVWSLADGKITSVFAIPARSEDDTVYELVGWSDASHLRLKRGPWGGDKRSPVTLVRDSQGWHLVESGNVE
ncbi:MAG TPA: hypothetical protein VKP60_22565 [Magnetospirillaceae bacterium]|nr:hypothetical protein [Magnetospirillaceae bacterium]